MNRIGFIGGGNMAESLIGGLLASGVRTGRVGGGAMRSGVDSGPLMRVRGCACNGGGPGLDVLSENVIRGRFANKVLTSTWGLFCPAGSSPQRRASAPNVRIR